ncbi:wnk kinase [Anaeramoeba flamelloides]|uniref:Wnk kinase n=1 Tax=Anaeramoeba flamelloides TaxID=1746091 RepID=A0ABQ8ZBM5_9EUKA|nr:wnk kinase [Anaeramoeba flamelloides]
MSEQSLKYSIKVISREKRDPVYEKQIMFKALKIEEKKKIEHVLRYLKSCKLKNFGNVLDWNFLERKKLIYHTKFQNQVTLSQYLKRHKNKQIDFRILKRILSQILTHLIFLHSQTPPILQKVLTPEYIYMLPNNNLVLDQIGLLCINDQELINSNIALSPEFFASNYDEKSDIFCLALCLLQALTFQKPYSECATRTEFLNNFKKGILPKSLSLVQNKFWKKIITKCLLPKEQRPSAKELLNEIQNIKLDEGNKQPKLNGNNINQRNSQLDVNNKKAPDTSTFSNLILNSKKINENLNLNVFQNERKDVNNFKINNFGYKRYKKAPYSTYFPKSKSEPNVNNQQQIIGQTQTIICNDDSDLIDCNDDRLDRIYSLKKIIKDISLNQNQNQPIKKSFRKTQSQSELLNKSKNSKNNQMHTNNAKTKHNNALIHFASKKQIPQFKYYTETSSKNIQNIKNKTLSKENNSSKINNNQIIDISQRNIMIDDFYLRNKKQIVTKPNNFEQSPTNKQFLNQKVKTRNTIKNAINLQITENLTELDILSDIITLDPNSSDSSSRSPSPISSQSRSGTRSPSPISYPIENEYLTELFKKGETQSQSQSYQNKKQRLSHQEIKLRINSLEDKYLKSISKLEKKYENTCNKLINDFKNQIEKTNKTCLNKVNNFENKIQILQTVYNLKNI